MSNPERITIRLTKAIKDFLKKEATKRKITISRMVRQIIKTYYIELKGDIL